METCLVIFKNIHQNSVQKMLQNKVKLLQTKNILINEAFDVNQSIHKRKTASLTSRYFITN